MSSAAPSSLPLSSFPERPGGVGRAGPWLPAASQAPSGPGVTYRGCPTSLPPAENLRGLPAELEPGCSPARRTHLSGPGPLGVSQVSPGGRSRARPAPCAAAGSGPRRALEPRREPGARAGGAGEREALRAREGGRMAEGWGDCGARAGVVRGAGAVRGARLRRAGGARRAGPRHSRRVRSGRWRKANSCEHLDRAGAGAAQAPRRVGRGGAGCCGESGGSGPKLRGAQPLGLRRFPGPAWRCGPPARLCALGVGVEEPTGTLLPGGFREPGVRSCSAPGALGCKVAVSAPWAA